MSLKDPKIHGVSSAWYQDGLRCRFGRYPAPWLQGGYEPMVCLCWVPDNLDVVDGGLLPWTFWRQEEVSPCAS